MAELGMQRHRARAGYDTLPLWVAHWHGPQANRVAGMATAHAFRLDTCMRRVLVTAEPAVAAQLSALQATEFIAGAAAYQFLLEVATGLRSAVPGETNVFGQFRRAWESHRQQGDHAAVQALAPVIAQLIRDTRNVRHAHLENLGGASYGSLVRRLVTPGSTERVLFVGAGELARSMLPFFRSFEIGVWNRHAPGAAFAAAARLFAPAEGAAAAGWAHHVIMTTPADARNDALWSHWLTGSLAQSVVHLGRRRDSRWDCPLHLTAYDLDDVFDLRHSQDNIRSLQLEQARHACRERTADFARGAWRRAGTRLATA